MTVTPRSANETLTAVEPLTSHTTSVRVLSRTTALALRSDCGYRNKGLKFFDRSHHIVSLLRAKLVPLQRVFHVIIHSDSP